MNVASTKKAIRVSGNILSTLFLIGSIAFCIYVFAVNYISNQNGTDPFYFGYRPCLIQTGSMEPYMMTNGIIMIKKVDSIDDLQVGDVVTYTTKNDAGKTIYITHRITDITADGLVRTKGDNNNVEDGYLLTMDNIIAKEVGVFNQPSVWLINTWESGTVGKAMIVCACLAIILFFIAINTLITGWLHDDELSNADIAEYTKLCRKLGLSPAEALHKDIDRLLVQLVEKDQSETQSIDETLTPNREEGSMPDHAGQEQDSVEQT